MAVTRAQITARLAARRRDEPDACDAVAVTMARLTQTVQPVPPARAEHALIVDNDGWQMVIARGDRAEVERIYRSMEATVRGLRIEAAS